MDRNERLEQLKSLSFQVHQTSRRQEHLPNSMPLHVHPESINWEKDLTRLQGEYNRLARAAMADGLLTPADLAEAGLPESISDH